jgi:hypothetical protein
MDLDQADWGTNGLRFLMINSGARKILWLPRRLIPFLNFLKRLIDRSRALNSSPLLEGPLTTQYCKHVDVSARQRKVTLPIDEGA